MISSSASRESRNEKLSASSLITVSPRDWLWIGTAGISGALSWLFYFLALQDGRATAVVALDCLSVVLVVLLAAVFLAESLTGRALLGAGCMVGGALLLIRRQGAQRGLPASIRE